MATAILCFACAISLFAQEPGQSVASLLQQGQALAQSGRLAEAEVSVAAASRLAPNDIATLTLLAEIKSRLGESQEAVLLFRQVLKQEPHSARAHLNLSIALADSGNFAEAISEVEKAVSLDPRNARVHLNYARMLVDAGRTSLARAEFERAAKLAPTDAEASFFWASYELNEHRYALAADLFTKTVQVQPDNARAYFLLGQSLESGGHRKQAIAAWEQAVAQDPAYEKALYALSQALRQSNPAASAEWQKKFEQTRERKQRTDRATELGNEGYAAMQQKSWAAAIDSLKRAIEICGECSIEAKLHQHLGLAEYQQGDTDAGENELRLALRLKPDDREIVESLQWVAARKSVAWPQQ